MKKKALITGITGQDGSYLCELLLSLGYEVFGTVRRNPESCPWLAAMASRVNFLYADLRKTETLVTALHKAWPDEVYNLAGQVFVPVSWERPVETFDVNIGGLARILKWVDEKKRDTRVYQASSSEMYGNGGGVGGRCDELSPFSPTSPYGVSKFAAHQLVRIYREKGLFVVGGILFNHESARRGKEMVTRKIATAVARWAAGKEYKLELGNLDARRDWGFAGDYVRAMVLMLNAAKPIDYVVGTGESHSIEELLDTACAVAGVRDWRSRVVISERLQRKNEIHSLCADPRRIREDLGWSHTKDFRSLVAVMVIAEQLALENER